MSVRWQFSLLLTALCAALAGDLSTNVARAQCSHGGGGFGPRSGGGFNPQIAQGLIAQQVQQQQLLQQVQQQQLLQQVRQQQQVAQMTRLSQQMRELDREGPKAIQAALKSPNSERRLVAVLTLNKYGPARPEDLIERLTDENATVRQTARRGLVKLSTARGVDFGPAANATRVAQETAARKWQTWFDRQDKRGTEAKTSAAKADERPDISTKIALPRKVVLKERISR